MKQGIANPFNLLRARLEGRVEQCGACLADEVEAASDEDGGRSGVCRNARSLQGGEEVFVFADLCAVAIAWQCLVELAATEGARAVDGAEMNFSGDRREEREHTADVFGTDGGKK